MMGEHDFKGFSSVKKTNKSTVRTVSRIDMDVRDRELDLIFEGNGFLYNMVRHGRPGAGIGHGGIPDKRPGKGRHYPAASGPVFR